MRLRLYVLFQFPLLLLLGEPWDGFFISVICLLQFILSLVWIVFSVDPADHEVVISLIVVILVFDRLHHLLLTIDPLFTTFMFVRVSASVHLGWNHMLFLWWYYLLNFLRSVWWRRIFLLVFLLKFNLRECNLPLSFLIVAFIRVNQVSLIECRLLGIWLDHLFDYVGGELLRNLIIIDPLFTGCLHPQSKVLAGRSWRVNYLISGVHPVAHVRTVAAATRLILERKYLRR